MKAKWIFIVLLVVNSLLGLLMLISISAYYIDPISNIVPSLFGLAFLQIFGLNLLFIVFWFFFNRTYLLVSLCFMIFGLTELPNHLQFNFEESPRNVATKIMTLNVRNFDLYNWSANKMTRDKILKTINRADAEIICLQEFFNTTDPAHDFVTLDTIMKFKRVYRSHVEYTSTVKRTEHWGIATFSTFPIVGGGKITFEEKSNNICIYTDLEINEDTVRVYNLHLASIKFGKEDYQYIEDMVGKMERNSNADKNLVRKLRDAFEKRSYQAKKVKEHMDRSPHPIVMCGDFNDTPTSYAYGVLSKGLNDSFRMRGMGFGSTYNGILPFLRIDYVMTDQHIRVLKHEVVRNNLSDHFPLLVSLEFD